MEEKQEYWMVTIERKTFVVTGVEIKQLSVDLINQYRLFYYYIFFQLFLDFFMFF